MNKTSDFRAVAAFTLVELSIVIVIVSLLIGGLASLRSYTRNAAITSVMNESKFFIDAFSQFQTRYNNPPGDYCATATVCSTNASPTANIVWPTANNGDGNGLIRAAGTPIPVERYLAFQHLALGGFIQGKYTGAANSNNGATITKGDTSNLGNVPGSNGIPNVAFIFDHPDATDGVVSGDSLYFDGLYGNILRIAGLPDKSGASQYSGIPDTGFLTPKQALQIDEKYDDGQPGGGNIVVPKNSAVSTCATTDVATTAVYDTGATNSEKKDCYLFLKMQ